MPLSATIWRNALGLLLGALALCCSAEPKASGAQAAVMPVNLWAATASRSQYEMALLEAILERTADQFGPYQLARKTHYMSARRGRLEVTRGEAVNIFISGLRPDMEENGDKLLVVQQPVMKGLLGYRSIITSRDAEFRASELTPKQLRQRVIGQGAGWIDAEILRHNGFTVNDSGSYQTLLAMLAYRRFDMVSLGVVEAREEVVASGFEEALEIDTSLMLYYPQAMVFHVSPKHRKLAERIEVGLKEVVADGTQDRLLATHFGPALREIEKVESNVVVLQHPHPSLMPELEEPLLSATP